MEEGEGEGVDGSVGVASPKGKRNGHASWSMYTPGAGTGRTRIGPTSSGPGVSGVGPRCARVELGDDASEEGVVDELGRGSTSDEARGESGGVVRGEEESNDATSATTTGYLSPRHCNPLAVGSSYVGLSGVPAGCA